MLTESALTWLDYLERDPHRVSEVIALFRETSTMDELGLAGVRNCYADLSFPGSSPILTRACYFLLVPCTFLRLERPEVPSSIMTSRARNEELRLHDRWRGELMRRPSLVPEPATA